MLVPVPFPRDGIFISVNYIMARYRLLIILLAAVFCSCRPGRPVRNEALEFTDGLGRRLALSRRPERIVSFAPSLTEMVYALGAGDRLVGVTSWCTFPPQARSKTVVGDFSNPNWERIVSLRPDLVILVAGERSPILSRLRALGIPAAAFRSESVDDVTSDAGTLGRLLGREAASDSLVALILSGLDSLRMQVAGVPPADRPRVFAEISDRPLVTAGPGSFLGQLIELAGGTNVAGRVGEPYAAVDPETVVRGRPDVILVLHPDPSPDEVRRRLGWSSVPAVRNGRIVTGLDLDLVLRPGPRLAQAARKLHEVIYAER